MDGILSSCHWNFGHKIFGHWTILLLKILDPQSIFEIQNIGPDNIYIFWVLWFNIFENFENDINPDKILVSNFTIPLGASTEG